MSRRDLTFLLFITLFTSCAGPMNPFGSELPNMMEYFNPLVEETILRDPASSKNTKNYSTSISFFPKSQNWHSGHDLYIIIETEKENLQASSLRLFWNHRDVTSSLGINKSISYSDERTLVLKVTGLRLLPNKENDISVSYINKNHTITTIDYAKPECSLKDSNEVVRTKPFNVKKSFIDIVNEIASDKNINPSVVTALIAQESSFDHQAVSYAKAVGLTQVTKAADYHIRMRYRHWKSDKRINKLPLPVVRAMISLGKINYKNDWRLNRKKSVIGGIEYIKYLNKYWAGNISLIERVYGLNFNEDKVLTELILASYNSGPYRVKTQLIKLGKNWIKSNELNAARSYVGKIKSYCYHFTYNKKIGDVINL